MTDEGARRFVQGVANATLPDAENMATMQSLLTQIEAVDERLKKALTHMERLETQMAEMVHHLQQFGAEGGGLAGVSGDHGASAGDGYGNPSNQRNEQQLQSNLARMLLGDGPAR